MGFYGGSSSGSASAGPTSGNTAVVLGDSLTIGQPTGDNSWASYANVLSKGRFNILYNAGVSGQTTTSIAARVQADVIAKNPKICVILAGTNDVEQGVPAATTRTNIESMITSLQSASITPILCTIPPASAAGSKQSGNDTVNFIIRSLATKYRLAVCDFHTPMLNASTGLFSSTYSTDLVHPLPTGAKLLAQKFVTDIVPTLPAFTMHLPTVNNTTNNLFTNGLFATNTWTAGTGTGTATTSLVADAAIAGNWFEINKTVNDALLNTWGSNYATVAPGKRYIISGRIQSVGETGGLSYSLFIGQNSGGTIFLVPDLTRDVDGTFYYEIIPAPGTTLVNLNLRVSAGIGKVRIAQVSIYDATTLGL